MSNENEYERRANERLEIGGFYEKTLEGLHLPEVEHVRLENSSINLAYMEMGDTLAAEAVVFSVIPYSTRLQDDSIKVRLAAQQTVLGPDVALVGVQVYEPRDQRLDHQERQMVTRGSFKPFADRLLQTIDFLGIRDDQIVYVYGYSMGGDVGIEAAYQNLTDANWGLVQIEQLGAFEPARVARRGAIAVVGAFGKSGANLYDNVVGSNSAALLEARGIDLDDPKAIKKHAAFVNKNVISYNRQDLRGNFSIIRGFTHADSITQLNEISVSHHNETPHIIVARMLDSGVTPHESLTRLNMHDKLQVFEFDGDHSSADNLRRSGAFILQATA